MTFKDSNVHTIAKKYAQAFINTFYDTLSHTDYNTIITAAQSLKKNKRLIFFLNLSSIDPVVKALSVEMICKKYNLNEYIKKLCYVLLEQKRLACIPFVLEYIAALFEQKNEIQKFLITSSIDIEKDEQKIIKDFIESKISGSIACTYIVDKSLIAGLRLQSRTLLWEHSIRKNIRLIPLSLIR